MTDIPLFVNDVRRAQRRPHHRQRKPQRDPQSRRTYTPGGQIYCHRDSVVIPFKPTTKCFLSNVPLRAFINVLAIAELCV